MRRNYLAGVMLCCAAITPAHATDDGIAVSAELFGGSVDSETVVSGYGTLTLPIQQQFGAHVEVLADKLGDDETQNIGAHLYWRDPDTGLLGLIASHTEFDVFGVDDDYNAVGIEAELYLSSFALAAQYARLDSDLDVLDDEDYLAFDVHWDSNAAWYLAGGLRSLADEDIGYAEVNFTPDSGQSPLTLYGGATWNDFDSQYLGLEYAVYRSSGSNLSLFVEADSGEDGYDGVFLGISYGAGPVANAPLISLFDRARGGF